MGKTKKKEENIEVDFGIGKLSFGGLFKGIGNLIDLASKLPQEVEEIQKSGEIKGLGDKLRGVYGFNIRTMGGKTVVDSFGNIKETPSGPVVEEIREPIVDIFDENDHLTVVAELPGVDENNIHIEVKGDILTLKTEKGERTYSKEVLLPTAVDMDTMEHSYKNGILEIRLKRQ